MTFGEHEDAPGSGKPGGPPADRLREQLERELGEVPPESPTEPAEPEEPEEPQEEEPAHDEDAGKGDES